MARENHFLPSVKEKTTKGGEEEPGLQTRVQEVNSLHVIFNIDRNGLVDGSESRDSGEVIAPLNTCVHIHHGERLLSQLTENLLLQILFQHLSAYKPS